MVKIQSNKQSNHYVTLPQNVMYQLEWETGDNVLIVPNERGNVEIMLMRRWDDRPQDRPKLPQKKRV